MYVFRLTTVSSGSGRRYTNIDEYMTCVNKLISDVRKSCVNCCDVRLDSTRRLIFNSFGMINRYIYSLLSFGSFLHVLNKYNQNDFIVVFDINA